MTSERRFLVVRLSSLGDILHAVPAVRMLRSSFPDARIDWLVETRFRFLVDAIPGIDAVHTVDTRSMRTAGTRISSWRSAVTVLRSLRRKNYDFALDFQGLLKSALFAAASGARVRCGFGRDLVRERPAHWLYHRRAARMPDEVHITRLNQSVAALAGGRVSGEGPVQLRVSSADVDAAERLMARMGPSDFIVLNPGGGWASKRWAPEKYAALASMVLHRLNFESVVTTGPGEEYLFSRIQASAASHLTHFPVPFLQLVPLMRRSALVVGGDTGPLHLACAIGRPVVGIFGPTSPHRNGPWSPDDESVVRPLPCSYCNGRACPTRNECMDIGVDQVFDAVVRRLETVRKRSAGRPS